MAEQARDRHRQGEGGPIELNKKPIRVLMVEDMAEDTELILRILQREGYEYETKRVDTPEAFKTALTQHPWDVILADYSMPRFSAPAALSILKDSGKDIPFIIVSGSIGEDTAVEAMRAGANDYLMKNNLTRLMPAIERAVHAADERRERRRAQDELRESEERYRGLIDVAFDGMLIHRDGRIQTANRALAAMFGYAVEELVGKSVFDLVAPESRDFIRAKVEDGLEAPYEAVCLKKDGTRLFVEFCAKNCTYQGQPARISVARDLTDRKRAEETILQQVYHDDLTELPNRALFKYYLTLELSHAQRDNLSVAVLLLDLDRFKTIIDTLGHAVGDRLLRAVADRLKKTLSPNVVLARMGGDEFLVLIGRMAHTDEVDLVIQSLREAFSAPWVLDGREFHITASIGIATYPGAGDTADILIKNADTALYRAKESGRDTQIHYTVAMNNKSSQRLALETSLRHVLERAEFVLFYQPQVHIQTGRIVGMEALIRWEHPELGLMSPADFIPLAEETGLIVLFGEWVLRTACAQTKAWHNAGLPPLRVAVNLSPRQFQHTQLQQTIERVLQDTSLDPHFLELEITEHLAMQDTGVTMGILKSLKDMGVRIALDDFGIGHSSLSLLQKLPIHTLKIDQSFIRNLPADAGAAVIAQTVITMAHNLALEVTAEGVETPDQLTFVKQHHCDIMQGYLFSRPVPSHAFEKMVRQPLQL